MRIRQRVHGLRQRVHGLTERDMGRCLPVGHPRLRDDLHLDATRLLPRTVKYEPALNNDADTLLMSLRDAVVSDYQVARGTSVLQAQGWVGDVRDLRFGDLHADVQGISFRVYYDLTRALPPAQVVNASVDFRMDLPGAAIRELHPSGAVEYRQVSVVPPSGVSGFPGPAASAVSIPVLGAADLFFAKLSLGEAAPGVLALPQPVDDAMVGYSAVGKRVPLGGEQRVLSVLLSQRDDHHDRGLRRHRSVDGPCPNCDSNRSHLWSCRGRHLPGITGPATLRLAR